MKIDTLWVSGETVGMAGDTCVFALMPNKGQSFDWYFGAIFMN